MVFNMKLNLEKNTFIKLFIFLYPILPMTFSVFGINARNILCLLLIVYYSLFSFNKKIYVIPDSLKTVIVIWFIIRSFNYLYFGNLVEVFYLALRTILVYYVLSNFVDSRENFLIIIKVLLIGYFILSIFGIIEEVTRFNIFSLFISEDLNYNPLRFGILRILSFSSQTIVYGTYLMFGLGLTAYYRQFLKQRNEKLLCNITYILIWINLLLTLSRSIIICAIISQLLILFFSGFSQFLKKIFKMILIGSILLAVLSAFIPQVASLLKNIFYMILAVFDSNYSGLIASRFGTDNLNAVGNRVDLYGWVWEKIKYNKLLGCGMNGKFEWTYSVSNGIWTWLQKKSSIEVQYLDILFHYGLVGLITEAFVYIFILIKSLLRIRSKQLYEEKIGFNAICFSLFACYFICFFSVNQSSDAFIFYIIVILFLIYNRKSSIQVSE